MDHVRLVGHGHVARVEPTVWYKGGVGGVLGRLHLQLGFLGLTLELHTPVLEPSLHLDKQQSVNQVVHTYIHTVKHAVGPLYEDTPELRTLDT